MDRRAGRLVPVLFALQLAGILTGACRSRAIDRDSSHRSPAFIIAESATNVLYGAIGDVEEGSYEAPIAFPAESFLPDVAARLESLGWTATEEFHDDPGNITSNRSGWSEFYDNSEGLPRRVRTWEGEWRHSTGAAITYMLRYWGNDATLLHVWIQKQPIR